MCERCHVTAAIQGGYAAPGALCMEGSSAGGWLVASALLRAPHVFAAAVLTVPCLDVLTSCMEERLGTAEWGNVRAQRAAYEVRGQNVTHGWHPRCSRWIELSSMCGIVWQRP